MPQALPHADAATAHHSIEGVTPEQMPRHIAVIMDGNGRWAAARGLARSHGHRQGALSVRRLLTEAAKLGIEYLTLYSFSIENWNRPREEIDQLMQLYVEYMASERATLVENNIRLRQIGRRTNLPPETLAELEKTIEATRACTGPTLVLAVNYSSRAEITDGVRDIAERVARGELDPADITEDTVSASLYTADIPDPDLLIRTSGEMRLSNYLLWQISYAELYITPTLWPEFAETDLHDAIRAYAARDRRYGRITAPHPLPARSS
ncbi:MAG: isoprenyl transferase [Phycisphaerales bacterium]